MRNSFLATAVLGASVLSVSAFGQEHHPIDATPYNISLKAGVYLPIDSNLRNVDTLFGGLGVEYIFPSQLIRGSETFMEVNWITRTTASSSTSLIPLTINQRFYGKPGSSLFGRGGRSFFYFGAGVTWIDPKGQAKLTFHGGVGADLGPRIFTEAAIYFGEQDNLGLRNTGVLVSIGYRF